MINRVSYAWRPLLGALCLLAATGAVPAAQATEACAASLKGQRINVVVPHRAGGGYDAYARLLAPWLESALDARVSVTNLPAGDGLAGLQAIRRGAAVPGSLVIGVTTLGTVLEGEHIARSEDMRMSDYSVLGVLSHASTVWLGRMGEDPTRRPGPLLVAGGSKVVGTMWLPAMALGLDIRVVKELTNSGESLLALLRGDIDYYVTSEQVLVRGAVDASKLQPWMFMGPPQTPVFRGERSLAGPDGRVRERVAGLSAPEQRRREAAAALAESLSVSDYLVLTGSQTPAPARTCLARVIEGISFDADFMTQAERQRLDPRPMKAADVQSWLRTQQKLLQDHRDLIDEAVRLSR